MKKENYSSEEPRDQAEQLRAEILHKIISNTLALRKRMEKNGDSKFDRVQMTMLQEVEFKDETEDEILDRIRELEDELDSILENNPQLAANKINFSPDNIAGPVYSVPVVGGRKERTRSLVKHSDSGEVGIVQALILDDDGDVVGTRFSACWPANFYEMANNFAIEGAVENAKWGIGLK
jgi:hypothetical protein